MFMAIRAQADESSGFTPSKHAAGSLVDLQMSAANLGVLGISLGTARLRLCF